MKPRRKMGDQRDRGKGRDTRTMSKENLTQIGERFNAEDRKEGY